MRKIVALICCVLCLAIGSLGGASHIHAAADHHHEMRGLHLDHVHLGDAVEQGPGGHHQHDHSAAGELHGDARHVAHHDGDALYLDVTARRALGACPRVVAATAAAVATIDAPSLLSFRDREPADPLRAPPRAGPVPARAPPA